jgi:hypothetical protein
MTNNQVRFVYMGGNQVVPRDVTHVIVHRSVDTIRRRAFRNCTKLVSIEVHDGVKLIEEEAFYFCRSLRRIELPGVRVIGAGAFRFCRELESVAFGDKLKIIGEQAFHRCRSLQNIKIPKARVIESEAFGDCMELKDAVLSKDLKRIDDGAFKECPNLMSIVIPLKDGVFDGNAFIGCPNLSFVDLVDGSSIRKTISSLLLQRWRRNMSEELESINWNLSPTNANTEIRRWIKRVIKRIERYKLEHSNLLEEAMKSLELALWKVKLLSNESSEEEDDGTSQPAEEVDIDVNTARKNLRITSGASIVIKNVLPFLKLVD